MVIKQQHVLVVSQYYAPENFRITDLCRAWVARGCRVTVLTGIPNYPAGKFYPGYGWFSRRRETLDGVSVIRLPILPRGKNRVGLVCNYYSFVFCGFFFRLFTRLKPDLVYVHAVSPMTQAIPAVQFARQRDIPCLVDVLDLWPENVEAVGGLKSRAILNAVGRMVDRVYRKTDLIAAASERFCEAIAARGVPPEKIAFWPQYYEPFYAPRPPRAPDGVFRIGFAGNLGFAQGLDVLPETARLLREAGVPVRFAMLGDGRAKAALQSAIERLDVGEFFSFDDPVAAERVPDFLGGCDAALVPYADSPVFEKTIPGKLQSCLACGRPILACGRGELARITAESGAGLCSPAGDPAALAANIERLYRAEPSERARMGDAGAAYAAAHYGREKLLDEMDALFERAKRLHKERRS